MICKYHLLVNEYYLLGNFYFPYLFLKSFTYSFTLEIWPIYACSSGFNKLIIYLLLSVFSDSSNYLIF